ncbi:MAG: glycoside hydrolase family 3 N-terminal domain-containing protein, partial [Nitrospirota bacterium]
MKSLSIKQKIYQMIVPRLDGEKIMDKSYVEDIMRLVKEGIGGFILFGGRLKEVKLFIEMLQKIAEIPLLIASDTERGLGQQVEGTTFFPCHMAFSAAINRHDKDDIKILRQAVNAMSSEAVYTGINTLLIPVLDININPDNPIICTRSFGDDPYVVSWFGKEVIKGIQNKGLIACGKHFPGHGDTGIDSHKDLPVIRKSINKLERCELIPFKEAIDSGVEMIMVGHLSIPAIDNLLPASLSKKVVTELLKETLCFNGLILSDALTMDAVSKRFTPLEGPAIYGWDDIDPVRKSV